MRVDGVGFAPNYRGESLDDVGGRSLKSAKLMGLLPWLARPNPGGAGRRDLL